MIYLRLVHFILCLKEKNKTVNTALVNEMHTPTTISSGFSFKLPTVVFIPGPSPILDSYHLNLCEALHKLRI